ncbi:MAG: DUF4150 domain-containing protein [Gammaproteobacteria bacterium]|nr:DUF4150 domain-containing protein [Gammaproteobacteria bacterium]
MKINGKPAATKGSTFESSNGDQAGSLGGVISGTTGKETEFISYSFGVKFEGKNVVRHADATMHNKKNTMGMVFGSAATAAMIKDDEEEKEKCPYCNKDEHDFADKWGSNNGNGQALRKNIIKKIEDHKWYTKASALQAHHLICSESMDDDDWYQFCKNFG